MNKKKIIEDYGAALASFILLFVAIIIKQNDPYNGGVFTSLSIIIFIIWWCTNE